MMTKPTKKEMDTIMVLLAQAKHIIHCKSCAELQAKIMNHAELPAKDMENPND